MSLLLGTPKFRVAICGAGIGGLVLAVTIGKFIDRDQVHTDLYEAHDAITTAGAGIIILQRTMEVMEALGLYEEISHVSTKAPSPDRGSQFRKSDIPEGGFEWFTRVSGPGQKSPRRLHRQELVDILKQHLPSSCTIHLNKRLITYDRLSAGSLALHFADGSTENTDVLIGADGIRSSVRKTLFGTIDPDLVDPSKIRHYSDASWTGTLIYRSVIPAVKLMEIDPNNIALSNLVIFCGKGKHCVSYPVSKGTLINVTAVINDEQKAGTPFEGKWVSDASREEVEEAFRGFEPTVRNILKCFQNPSRWALHVVNELPLSTSGRVGLIDDCHAMASHLGAGAGQAIEDAFVLGRLLAHPLTTLDNVPAALRAYQDVRLSAAQIIARNSMRVGRMYQFNVPGVCGGTDEGNERRELDNLQEMILRDIESSGHGSAITAWQQAERNLQESIGLHAYP